MKALTLHGVHAWCVMHAGKYVENRSWLPSPDLIGERIAIHAGQNPGHVQSREWVNKEFPVSPKQFPKGVILGTVRLKGVIAATSPEEVGFWGLTDDEVEAALSSVWAGESEAWWIFDDPRPLDQPLPCKGALQLWNVPEDLVGPLDLAPTGKPTVRAETAKSRGSSNDLSPSSNSPTEGSLTATQRSIDDVPVEEILAVICAMATAAPQNEQELLRATSRHLGFARMGARVEQALRAQLASAVRLKVLQSTSDGVRVAGR